MCQICLSMHVLPSFPTTSWTWLVHQLATAFNAASFILICLSRMRIFVITPVLIQPNRTICRYLWWIRGKSWCVSAKKETLNLYSTPTWRIIPVSITVSNFHLYAIWKGSHNPIIRGRNRSALVNSWNSTLHGRSTYSPNFTPPPKKKALWSGLLNHKFPAIRPAIKPLFLKGGGYVARKGPRLTSHEHNSFRTEPCQA